jgi:TRAP-type C4-dicarboxylate transport system permease small subunit
LLIVWHGRDLVSRNFDVEATTVPVPMSFIYLPVVLAGLVTAAQALGEAWEILRGAQPAVAPDPAGPIE